MRVLTTTLCYPTPADPEQGIFIARRAAAIARREGVNVEVASPQPWCPVLRRSRSFERTNTPLPASFPQFLSIPVLNWATDGLGVAHALQFCIRHRAAGSPGYDLIDAHFVYPEGVGACLAGRRLGIPVVVTIRGKIVSLSRRAIRRMQIAWMLRRVQARIAVSRSLARWTHRVGGDDLHVDVIPNGIDTATFHPVDRQQTRAALGWDPHARYVLAVGHLQRLKGFDRLVAIAPAVRDVLGDVRFVLAGSLRGERKFRHAILRDTDRVNREACAAQSSSTIEFVGPVTADRLNLMYGAADLFVSCSRSEGWCNAIAEAMAAGTPVLATDVGGNSEQITDRELGAIVPEGDLDALRKSVVTLLQRQWDRPTIAARGASRTWDHVAGEVFAVYRRVLAEWRRAHPAIAANRWPACEPQTAPRKGAIP